MTPELIRMVIADDHSIYREGLKTIIQKDKQIEIVGEASNGDELLAITRELQPDVILTDIEMPKINGIIATKQLIEEMPALKVLCISFIDSYYSVLDMIEAGAIGYICKSQSRQEVYDAIKTVYQGKPYFSITTGRVFAADIGNSKSDIFRFMKPGQFSERELEIIKLTCEDKSCQEIGKLLYLSPRTIETHRHNIYHKMNVNTVVGMLIYAIKHNLYYLPSTYTNSKA